MADYDFTATLSPLDFETLSKDLLQEELGITLEVFSEGRDKGIDLRYAPTKDKSLIVQCKRYGPDAYLQLKSKLKSQELPKIRKLNPSRYILTTSVNLSVGQVDELTALLSPFVKSSGDIYGRERLNSLLAKFPEIERRTLKLWISSADVLEKLLNADLHAVSENEVARVKAAAKLYVKNPSFDKALKMLKEQHVCIISGIPGIGKTMLARMLLLYFYNVGFEIIKIESDIREANAAAYYKKPRFYYYDDFLGQTALPDKLNKNEDQKLLDFIAAVRESKNSKFVLTTREYILNQARRTYEKVGNESFEHEIYILDLAEYSRRIRAQILYNHLFFSDLPQEYSKAIHAGRGYIKIVDHRNFNPRLIEFLTGKSRIRDVKPEGYFAFCIAHLNDPKAIWKHAFEQQLSRAASNLLLVLTTLPTEAASDDLAAAFSAFHTAQARRYAFSSAPQDYMNALKELEGTFVSTRRAQDLILVKFQNPSVRDFMQNYLLESELVGDILGSCVRFEQPRWFWATLVDGESKLPRGQLGDKRDTLRRALREMFRAPSCDVTAFDLGAVVHVERNSEPDLPARMAFLLPALGDSSSPEDQEFILREIRGVGNALIARSVDLSDCISLLGEMRRLGYDTTAEGRHFGDAVKSTGSDVPSCFQEFRTLAELVEDHPGLLDDEQVQRLANQFEGFSAKYADEIKEGNYDDISSPDEIRGEVSQIEKVGNAFSVKTNAVCDALREHAREVEIEQETSRDWVQEDGPRAAREDHCADSELDSMFSTLEQDHSR
jgi:hypothetical protein